MDETRQLLKIFGVAATDFEAEAQKLAEVAARFSSRTGKDEIAKHLRNVTELCRELNTTVVRCDATDFHGAERVAGSVC
jgi:hypothetical protein